MACPISRRSCCNCLYKTGSEGLNLERWNPILFCHSAFGNRNHHSFRAFNPHSPVVYSGNDRDCIHKTRFFLDFCTRVLFSDAIREFCKYSGISHPSRYNQDFPEMLHQIRIQVNPVHDVWNIPVSCNLGGAVIPSGISAFLLYKAILITGNFLVIYRSAEHHHRGSITFVSTRAGAGCRYSCTPADSRTYRTSGRAGSFRWIPD